MQVLTVARSLAKGAPFRCIVLTGRGSLVDLLTRIAGFGVVPQQSAHCCYTRAMYSALCYLFGWPQAAQGKLIGKLACRWIPLEDAEGGLG